MLKTKENKKEDNVHLPFLYPFNPMNPLPPPNTLTDPHPDQAQWRAILSRQKQLDKVILLF